MSAREAVLEELDAAVSAPSGAAVVSGAPTCSVALLGQPNSGKSTLFNALTGSRQRVGNWPGKTVEKKEGGFSRGGVDYAVCDLPGTYSLSANSEEEVVTRDYIASGRADVVCVLADASQLERSLYMLADFAGVDCACMLVLNLMDVAEAQGKRIDAKVLERRLGIPVVPFVAADRAHCDLFYQALDRAIADPHALDATALAEACRVEFGAVYDDVRALVPERSVGALTPAWLTGKLLEGDVPVRALVDEALDERDRARLAAALEPIEHGVQRGGTCKFSWIDGVLDGAVRGSRTRSTLSRFDRIATGSRWGKPLAIGIILVGLLATFVPAMPIMAVGGLFSLIGEYAAAGLVALGAPAVLGSFVSGVLFDSLRFATMMVGFVFGINLVFGALEEVGYMARISYVFDSTMARFGLQGKSIMPFIVCLGCTIGGASGTRVIDSWGQRVLTVAMAWAVPCASTWGVVPVLAVAFFGPWSPVVVVAIFLTSLLLMYLVGKLFGPHLVSGDERAGLVMELPPYHAPRWKNVFSTAIARSKHVFKRAVRVVFIVTAVVWLLVYSPDGNPQNTALYAIGEAIEPVTSFFGLGWQTFMAYLCAMAIKESALGVLSGLFLGTGTLTTAVGGMGPVAADIGQVMASAISQPEALAFMFAFTFNVPCMASVAATYGETHSGKWTALMIAFYFCASLALAFVVFHVSSLFLG